MQTPRTSELLEVLSGLLREADNCFDDLKQLGAISRPNAVDYRKYRARALELLAVSNPQKSPTSITKDETITIKTIPC